MTGLTEFELSVGEEISAVFMERPHVFILGAGASRAAVPIDKNGRTLPLMSDIAKLTGLDKVVAQAGFSVDIGDFEALYSRLSSHPHSRELLETVERRIEGYFQAIEIPDGPTIYDHLVMSLRKKDLVATFNWDPLLIQAYRRLARLGFRDLPRSVFLHGNVAIGVCHEDRIVGSSGRLCSKCRKPLQAVPLLYPVTQKDYAKDRFIENEWNVLTASLRAAFMVTIFGYRAPATDTEAIELMSKAWGTPAERSLEQTEIITRPGADEDAVRETWDRFIHTHHYEVHFDFYDSWVAKHPRRSGEAYVHQYIDAKFISDNPVPRKLDFAELVRWFHPLLGAETEMGRKHG
jgi:hypothetical protein